MVITEWTDMLLQNNLLNAPSFGLMANECMDITVVKEFSIYCHWIENEAPVEHFMEKLPLKKAYGESIYSVLWKAQKKCHKLEGMGFDSVAKHVKQSADSSVKCCFVATLQLHFVNSYLTLIEQI